jgi:hypothetical protein
VCDILKRDSKDSTKGQHSAFYLKKSIRSTYDTTDEKIQSKSQLLSLNGHIDWDNSSLGCHVILIA